MKCSLPNIKVPFKGMLNCGISTISVNLDDLSKSVELFEKEFRGPLLAFCCRIELIIDKLILTVFFYLFQIDFDEHNKRKESFNKLFFSSNILNLNSKITFLLKSLENFEKNHFLVEEKNNEGIINLKEELDKFRNIRNLLAHAHVEPKVKANKKLIDIYVKYNGKLTKVDESYIQTKIDKLTNVNYVLSNYSKNFGLTK